MERLEEATLAGYAQKSGDSAGRKHREPRHPYRTEYQRDRERIVHSRAFRRLEYKTQVFLNGTGDHLRTRLTHTIEVASISRSIARALGLNEDLAEAIALAHDLGHAPFGHSGEEMLDSLMRDNGGFEHNTQSLRIVEMIEKKDPGVARGLNLSLEALEGHAGSTQEIPRARAGEWRRCGIIRPSLEAQIANLADEITYYSHDLDDGLDFNSITLKQLGEMEIWQESYELARTQFPKLKGKELTTDVFRRIIDRQVEDVIVTSFESDQGCQRSEDSWMRRARRKKRR